MTVINRQRIREIRLGNDAQHSPSNKAPLTAESIAVLGH